MLLAERNFFIFFTSYGVLISASIASFMLTCLFSDRSYSKKLIGVVECRGDTEVLLRDACVARGELKEVILCVALGDRETFFSSIAVGRLYDFDLKSTLLLLFPI